MDLPPQSGAVVSKKNAVAPWPGQTKASEHELFGATDEESNFINSLDPAGKRQVQRINTMRENLEFSESTSDQACADQKKTLNDNLDTLLATLTSANGKVDSSYDASLSALELKVFALRASCLANPSTF
jgi:hypothetical protein